MGTILDGLCTIKLLKSIPKWRSKDLGNRSVENFSIISEV